MTISAPSRCSRIVIRPTPGLPRLLSSGGVLNAVYNCIAQHVLERRQHLIKDLSVEFAGGAFDGQLGALAGILCRLSNKSRQTRNMALKRHHACAHESILQLCSYAGLLDEQAFGLGCDRFEQVLEADEIAGRFG